MSAKDNSTKETIKGSWPANKLVEKPVEVKQTVPTKEDKFASAYKIYYENGESGKQTTNGIIRAFAELILGSERVAKIEEEVNSNKKGGLNIEIK